MLLKKYNGEKIQIKEVNYARNYSPYQYLLKMMSEILQIL